MDKEDTVYIYTMEYYSFIKKNKILPFETTWMDLEGIMLSEKSQTEKDNYYICRYKRFTYMWNLKNKNKGTNITKQK